MHNFYNPNSTIRCLAHGWGMSALMGYGVKCICCRLVISFKGLQEDSIHGSKTSVVAKIEPQAVTTLLKLENMKVM
jgi:hypothetical protein